MTLSKGHPNHCLRLTSKRSGLTLIEIMIALTMTLIVLFAMAQAFKFASGEIAGGRAILEMSNRLRNAQQLLRRDLAGLTVEVRPHTEIAPNGYFEYVDGPRTDTTVISTAGSVDGYLGDYDDILAFTARNLDGSYRGRFLGDVLQSSFAEIIWFTEETDLNGDGITDLDGDTNVDFNETVTLYRRVLLIRPELNGKGFFPFSTGEETGTGDPQTDPGLEAAVEFFAENDISARWIDSNGDGARDMIVANSLSDLARRENRYGRDSLVYPYAIDTVGIGLTKMGVASGSGPTFDIAFSGDDVLLTDLAAFDAKVYSPNIGVDLLDLDGNDQAEVAVESSDIGFNGALTPSAPALFPETRAAGGFIDLAVSLVAFDRGLPAFATLPFDRGLGAWAVPTYCTWSPHYEIDGVDQDSDGDIDEGTNGIDDDDVNGVDDDGERETSPPYPFPIRGVEVTIRIIEKNTKQVRQTSVVHNTLPQ